MDELIDLEEIKEEFYKKLALADFNIRTGNTAKVLDYTFEEETRIRAYPVQENLHINMLMTWRHIRLCVQNDNTYGTREIIRARLEEMDNEIKELSNTRKSN